MELVPLAKAVHIRSYPYDYWDALFDSQVDWKTTLAHDRRCWERERRREREAERRWLSELTNVAAVAAVVHPELPPAVAEDLLVRSLSFIENFRKVFGTQ